MKQTIEQFYSPETLRRLQLTELGILKKFDAMCEKHGLTYIAAYGTALGAIRHKGIIPWDDDIDVCMPRKDYERLAELVPQEFGENYTLLNAQIDPNYPFGTSRIMLKGTEFRMLSMKNCPCELGIFLDIFCLDDLPEDEKKRKRMIRKCFVLEKMCILRITPFPNSPYRGIKRVIVYGCCAVASLLLKPFPKKALHKWLRDSMSKYRDCGSGYYGILLGMTPSKDVYPRDMLFPIQRVPFEDTLIPIPNDAHGMMRQVYGDTYMTPPPEGKRSNIIPYKLSFGDEEA